MMNRYLVCIVLLLSACNSKHSKENLFGTSKLSDSLYIEVYNTYSGGVFAGSSYDYYLTDSVNFRKLAISVSHDNERIMREHRGTDIFFCKVIDKSNDLDTLETVTLNIARLKEERDWD